MKERNYEFRKRMHTVHKKNRRIKLTPPAVNQVEIDSSWCIWMPDVSNRVLYNAVRDLEDYFAVSMNVYLKVLKGGEIPDKAIVYDIDEKETGYRLTVSGSRIKLSGKTDRLCARAGYYLEDLLNFEEAPYVQIQDTQQTPMYSPRMTHSGFGLDEFPDAHLKNIAHAGMDAILVFVRGVNTNALGKYQDFNDLIYRANGYGLDVYAYSYLRNEVYPEGEEGKKFYDELYGNLFKECPGFKGVILVGESCQFRSRDPRTSGMFHRENQDKNGKRLIDKPNPGWFPCSDFPELINMIKGAIHRYSPDAEVVLWSYNWGKVEKQPRLELIRALPKDITLQATFEMFEYVEREGVLDRMADYCLYFEGPGQYFDSEAKEAKEQGLKLYSMTNTAGMTWDIGVIPYVPAPYQWIKRYIQMERYHRDYGLCGLMESHHYGFYPSFISELAKYTFVEEHEDCESILRKIAVRDFSEDTADRVLEAFRLFSEGIAHIVTNSDDQYGPYRIGPSYPLLLFKNDVVLPNDPHARFPGNAICRPMYRYDLSTPDQYKRIEHEIRYARIAEKSFDKGADILESVIPLIHEFKREEALRLVNLCRFIARCVTTAINVKLWRIEKEKVVVNGMTEETRAELIRIADAEIENARKTIPLVEFDSRLGYEPSMEYMCDKERIEWKIATTEKVIKGEVK